MAISLESQAPSPAVSVIVPTWNRAELVCKAIDSVLAQSYSGFELIVVDDGSTDDTPRRIASYGKRLTCLTQRNSGVSSARNLGIAHSRGRWIAFLDSDDTWDPRKLQIQMNAVEAAGDALRVCFTDCRVSPDGADSDTLFRRASFGTGDGSTLGVTDPIAQVTARSLTVYMSSVLANGDWLRAREAFDPRLQICEDTDLLLRMALDGGYFAIDLPLVNIGTGGDAPTSRLSHGFDASRDQGFESRAQLHLKWRDELRLPGDWAAWNIEQMRHIYADWFATRFRHGEIRRAARAFAGLAGAEGSSWIALSILARRMGDSIRRRWQPAAREPPAPWRP